MQTARYVTAWRVILNGMKADQSAEDAGRSRSETESSSDDLRSATRGLREAITELTRAIGGAGAELRAELSAELATASRELTGGLRHGARGIKDQADAIADAALKRQTKTERTRAQLIEAGRQVFAEKGYEAASVADIAEVAGYTKGALYAHFESKQELFLAIFKQAQDSDSSDSDTVSPLMHVTTGEEGLADILLSLEAYLYALRHPTVRPLLLPTVEETLTQTAKEIAHKRTGSSVEPDREDLDTALAFAAQCTFASILAQLLPARWDVNGAAERIANRLLSQ